MKKRALSIIFVLFLLSSAQGGGSSLLVEVKGRDGRPLRDACVTLVPREGEIIFRKANGKGQVRLKQLVPGDYRVIVKADGYEAQKREVTVGSSADTVAFLMQPRS